MMPGLACMRLGDFCSGHPTAEPRAAVGGSMDVFINNKQAVRVGDAWDAHGAPRHLGTGISGSPTVFVNGMPLMRTNDPISCGSLAGQGSLDTFSG